GEREERRGEERKEERKRAGTHRGHRLTLMTFIVENEYKVGNRHCKVYGQVATHTHTHTHRHTHTHTHTHTLTSTHTHTLTHIHIKHKNITTVSYLSLQFHSN